MKMRSQPLARIWKQTESHRSSSRCVQGNIIDDKAVQDEVGYEYYDIAVANILADVIIMLQKEIPVHIKKRWYLHHIGYH